MDSHTEKKFMEKIKVSHPNFTNEEYVATRVMDPLGGKGKRGLRIYGAAKQAGILTGDEQSRWDRTRPLITHMLKKYVGSFMPEAIVAEMCASSLKSCTQYLVNSIPYFYPDQPLTTCPGAVYGPTVFFRMADGGVRVFTNVDINVGAMVENALPAYFMPRPPGCDAPGLVTLSQDIDTFMRWVGGNRLLEDLFI